MGKGSNITLHRQATKVRKLQVRTNRVAITVYIDKADSIRLAKEIEKKWGKKK